MSDDLGDLNRVLDKFATGKQNTSRSQHRITELEPTAENLKRAESELKEASPDEKEELLKWINNTRRTLGMKDHEEEISEENPEDEVSIPPIRKPSLEYEVTLIDNKIIKYPKKGFEFKVKVDYERLKNLGELAPITEYDEMRNCLIQEAVSGRFATEEELEKVGALIRKKGYIPRGLLTHDIIVTPTGEFKVIDVGGFERSIKEEGNPDSIKETEFWDVKCVDDFEYFHKNLTYPEIKAVRKIRAEIFNPDTPKDEIPNLYREAIKILHKAWCRQHPRKRCVFRERTPQEEELSYGFLGVSEAYSEAKGNPDSEKEKEPWAMNAREYQRIMGVHEPWIAEISPAQYAGMSKREKKWYDEKRAKEWKASADIKAEWREKVTEAYKKGVIDLNAPNLSEDAKSVIIHYDIEQDRVEFETILNEVRKQSTIRSMDEITVGDSVFFIMTRNYHTVVKKHKKTVKLDNEMNVEPYSIRRLSTDDEYREALKQSSESILNRIEVDTKHKGEAGYGWLLRLIEEEKTRRIEEPMEEKEPWTMTKGSFLSSIYAQPMKPREARKYHREQVEKALKEDKPVPTEVLEDYPELKKPFTKEELKKYAGWIYFNVNEARNYLLKHGHVYTMRDPLRKEGWGYAKKGKDIFATVNIKKVALGTDAPKYVTESGFLSDIAWYDAVAEIGEIPERMAIFRVDIIEEEKEPAEEHARKIDRLRQLGVEIDKMPAIVEVGQTLTVIGKYDVYHLNFALGEIAREDMPKFVPITLKGKVVQVKKSPEAELLKKKLREEEKRVKQLKLREERRLETYEEREEEIEEKREPMTLLERSQLAFLEAEEKRERGEEE